MELVVGWLVLALIVGLWADRRGRNGTGYFLLALVLSPILVWLILLAIGPGFVPPVRQPYVAQPYAAPRTPEPVAPDHLRTIASLADLRDRGAISAAEYEAKKSQLLAQV